MGCSQYIPFLSPQVSGAVLISGLVQLVLGALGVCGWAVQRCGPMVLAPSLSIIGLSAYKEAAFFCSANWGVALLYVSLGAKLLCSPVCFLAIGTGERHPHGARHTSGAPYP